MFFCSFSIGLGRMAQPAGPPDTNRHKCQRSGLCRRRRNRKPDWHHSRHVLRYGKYHPQTEDFIVIDLHGCGKKIDRYLIDTGKPCDTFLHMSRAGGAAHAGNIKRLFHKTPAFRLSLYPGWGVCALSIPQNRFLCQSPVR